MRYSQPLIVSWTMTPGVNHKTERTGARAVFMVTVGCVGTRLLMPRFERSALSVIGPLPILIRLRGAFHGFSGGGIKLSRYDVLACGNLTIGRRLR